MPKVLSNKTTPPDTSPIKKEVPSHTESSSISPSKSGKRTPWTGDETYQLFQAIYSKPDGIPWKDICVGFPGKDIKVSS
jgi:hypothetical protein